MNKLFPVASLVLGTLCLAVGGQAATFNWVFAPGPGSSDPGVASTYKDVETTTFKINAYGYATISAAPDTSTIASAAPLGSTWGGAGSTYSTGTVTPTDLYNKFTTSVTDDETGLGLNNDQYSGGQHEIYNKSFVQLNVSDLIAHNLNNLTMTVSSIQGGEGYYLWGSNAQGTPGTLLREDVAVGSSESIDTFTVPNYGSYNYYSVSAIHGNVLVRNGVTAQSAVPEPGAVSFAAMFGLSGIGLLRRRFVRK